MSLNSTTRKLNNKIAFTTANPFEQNFGYHRAVRRGPFIAVSGTTALRLLSSRSPTSADPPPTKHNTEPSSKVHSPGDAYGQAIHVFNTCVSAIEAVGGKKEDVIRVRMFVANGDDCGVVGDAFRATFGGQPLGVDDEASKQDLVAATATMIVVPGGFVDPEILVEIEVDAFVL